MAEGSASNNSQIRRAQTGKKFHLVFTYCSSNFHIDSAYIKAIISTFGYTSAHFILNSTKSLYLYGLNSRKGAFARKHKILTKWSENYQRLYI